MDFVTQMVLSVVQFLFYFVNNRIAKFSLAEKPVLVAQPFMCLHDNTKQIMVKLHTPKGRWFKYLVYLNDFNTLSLCLITFDWVQKLNGIKHSCMHIFGV